VQPLLEKIGNVEVKSLKHSCLIGSSTPSPPISVRKRPGRPTDSRQAFSPARPGQDETDLVFVGQASWVPGGAVRLSVNSI